MDDSERTPSDAVADAYDALAAASEGLDREASPWGDSHFQRDYAWPATRSVLPDVDGDRVLLAGCGRGDHVGWFRERGAAVTGVDVSAAALRLARERSGDEAAFCRADVTEPLPFADGAFDLVLSHLALSHVADWRPVLRECRRVLDPDGALVATTIHPLYLRSTSDVGDYYATEEVRADWEGEAMPTFYRPVGEAIEAFPDAGLRLDVVDEPKPRDAYADHEPERYRDAMATPALLVVRATPVE